MSILKGCVTIGCKTRTADAKEDKVLISTISDSLGCACGYLYDIAGLDWLSLSITDFD
tara:strand:+ start:7214 stop:7387 length:174 start_codon:yes stop_codon:yes gene_type:complete